MPDYCRRLYRLHPYKHFSKVPLITQPANLATKLGKNQFSGKHCTVKILPL